MDGRKEGSAGGICWVWGRELMRAWGWEVIPLAGGCSASAGRQLGVRTVFGSLGLGKMQECFRGIVPTQGTWIRSVAYLSGPVHSCPGAGSCTDHS